MASEPAIDDAALAARQAESQREFYRALAAGSPGARLIELPGVQATAVPARPWFSIFSASFYETASALATALPSLREEYAKAAVMSWSVWVSPEDEPAASLLQGSGFECVGTPMRMAGVLDEMPLEPQGDLDLVVDPSWEVVARCNDRAYGVLEDWTMAAAFESMDDPRSHLYAARADGDVVAALIAREQDGDCYLWFVATVPEAQRRGIGGELLRHALRAAHERGCQTTTLEATPAGEPLYRKLGYRPLGRFRRFEERAAG